ncbi:sensor histidine kinase [Crossiella cryophila]|uniref:Signal transduction histidine kinase n=1 Tax=Crossiella cryophila TaxID=43355 RepID=A0A7W7FVI0_9PSEU|nr:ATP-binding protein [Crossiella cryophila]MBB4679070.1 signal transduction histidine kinase [Crossiella cryophila]
MAPAVGISTYLSGLMLSGMHTVAAPPEDRVEQVVDPAGMSGAERMWLMVGSYCRPPVESVLTRSARYVLLVAVLARLVGLPLLGVIVLARQGIAAAWPVAVFTVVALGLNVAVAVRFVVHSGMRKEAVHAALWADLALGMSAVLGVWLLSPGPVFRDAITVVGAYFLGLVFLWTVLRGVVFGAAVAVLGAMLLLPPGEWTVAAGWAVDFLLAVVVGACLLFYVGLAVRLAISVGIIRGRDAERVRGARQIHDTVLQALEVMAMATPADASRAAETLSELRQLARREAARLRRNLERPGVGAAAVRLSEDLAELVADMAGDGLRARLVLSEINDSLTQVRRAAIRDATREALRNSVKHGGGGEVVVRVEERDGGIAVTTRDYGTGFDLADRPAGFGIRESITARLGEVGGTAKVDSRPSGGTRVTLWVPR